MLFQCAVFKQRYFCTLLKNIMENMMEHKSLLNSISKYLGIPWIYCILLLMQTLAPCLGGMGVLRGKGKAFEGYHG